MIAVTLLVGNPSDTCRTAVFPLKYADRNSVRRRTAPSATMAEARARGVAGGEAENEHQRHQDQRRAPREPVPFFERSRGIHVDLQRKGLHRLQHVDLEVEVAQGGK